MGIILKCKFLFLYENEFKTLSRSLIHLACELSVLPFLLDLPDNFPLRLKVSLTAENFLTVV